MSKDQIFADKIKKYILEESKKEFGYAGLAESKNFIMINTGEDNIIIKINVEF